MKLTNQVERFPATMSYRYTMDHHFLPGLQTPGTQQKHAPKSFTDAEPLLGSACGVDMKEDEQSILLSIDMPGVLGKDIGVSIQRGVLSIRGFRCVKDRDGRIVKRQRLCRRFSVDTDVVDAGRATANVWNGVLNLYAPKKSKPVTVKIPVTEMPDCAFSAQVVGKRWSRGAKPSDGPFRIPDDENCAVH
jgi:HSP20 family molecular chaperone IbpA